MELFLGEDDEIDLVAPFVPYRRNSFANKAVRVLILEIGAHKLVEKVLCLASCKDLWVFMNRFYSAQLPPDMQSFVGSH